MDVAPLVAVAAANAEPGHDVTIEVMRVRAITNRIQFYVDQMIEHDETRVFRKRLNGVDIVKDDRGPGKARLELEPDDGSDEPEFIETDWLTNAWAWMIYHIALCNVGERVAVWKKHTDPADGAPQGFRQCVWLEGPSYPSSVPPAPAQTPRAQPSPAAARGAAPSSFAERIVERSKMLDDDQRSELRAWVDANGYSAWRTDPVAGEGVLAHIDRLMEKPF